jgi:hypothetical protein
MMNRSISSDDRRLFGDLTQLHHVQKKEENKGS